MEGHIDIGLRRRTVFGQSLFPIFVQTYIPRKHGCLNVGCPPSVYLFKMPFWVYYSTCSNPNVQGGAHHKSLVDL